MLKPLGSRKSWNRRNWHERLIYFTVINHNDQIGSLPGCLFCLTHFLLGAYYAPTFVTPFFFIKDTTMINRLTRILAFSFCLFFSCSSSAALFESYIKWLNTNEALIVKSRVWLCGGVALTLQKDTNGKPYTPSTFKIVAEHWKNDSYFIKTTGEYILEAESFAARFNSATHRICLYQLQPIPSTPSGSGNAGTQVNITVGGTQDATTPPQMQWVKVNLGDFMTIAYSVNNHPCWGIGTPGPQYGPLNMNS